MKHDQIEELIRQCTTQRAARPDWSAMATGPTPRKGRFLWNLPADLLDAAWEAGGRPALGALLYLWLEASQRRRLDGRANPRWLDAIPCPSRPRRRFAGSRSSFLRGLATLERAHLIRRHRRGQRTLRVDILWVVSP
jgi:hypothetical protein